MKKKILLALILTPLCILFSQKKIVQEDIFLNHKFSQDWVFGLTSMNDGTHYTTLERAETTSIDKYNYETGEKVATSSAKSFKKMSLELGGKNSSIVFSDCDLEKTLDDVVRAGFLNQGQICLCGSRVLIEDSIYENFKKGLVEKVNGLKMGDQFDESTEIGSLISKEHRDKVLSYVDLAIEEGGEILTGLQSEKPIGFEGGNWMNPVIIEGLSVNSRCSTEEIFGPIVTIHSFSSEQEVISIANNTDYGLD